MITIDFIVRPLRPPGKVLKPEDFEEMERQARGRGGFRGRGRGRGGGRGGLGWRPQLGFTPNSGYRDNASADSANRMIRSVVLVGDLFDLINHSNCNTILPYIRIMLFNHVLCSYFYNGHSNHVFTSK